MEHIHNTKYWYNKLFLYIFSDNLRSLESSGKMSGVLTLINGTDPGSSNSAPIIQRPIYLSPDEKCPSCQFGLYRNDESRYIWNPNVSDITKKRSKILFYNMIYICKNYFFL